MKSKKVQAIQDLTKEITYLRKTLKMVKAQTVGACKAGKHVLRGQTTSNGGEYLTYCLCCTYSNLWND
jgi:hypothetical protein